MVRPCDIFVVAKLVQLGFKRSRSPWLFNMHILVYKMKDSSLGKLVGFLLVFALTVPLITHYYLGKHAQPSEATLVSFQSRTKLDNSVDQVDLLSGKIENLQDQVKELQRIKLSLSNELRELEGKKNKLREDIRDFSSKAESTKNQAEKFRADISLAQRELEQIKLAKLKAKDCPELPNLKLPYRLTAAFLSEDEAHVDNRRASHCTLDRCFDFSRCSFTSGFPVFVYEQAVGHISSDVVLMQQLLKESPYYVSEPEKACLYVLLIGSLEQIEAGKRTSELESKLRSLPYWSGNGRNHLLLYIRSTTRFSTSSLSLEIDTGLALIAQSTFSIKSTYRHGFDVVLPPLSGPIKGDMWNLSTWQLPAKRKYLLSFQGEHSKDFSESMSSVKEELLNISTEARDVFLRMSLSPSHSTVGDEWFLYGNHDERKEILKQSTFSLIISSNNATSSWDSTHIRLLEALQYGAIPVVLSSEVVLPFDDMIDWRKAAMLLAPSRVTELNFLLRTVTNDYVLEMRRQGRFLWETYLSTTKAIFETTLATIRTRLSIPAHPVLASPSPFVFTNPPVTSLPDPEAVIHFPQESPTFIRNLTATVVDAYNMWNTPPGAFRMYPSSPFFPVLPSSAPFRNSSKGFELIGAGMGGSGEEFSKALGGNYPTEQFTVVILTYQRELVLMESIQRLVGLHYLNKVVVVWNSPEMPSLSLRWPNIGVPVHVSLSMHNATLRSISKFSLMLLIETF